MDNHVRILPLRENGDSRGRLVAIEGNTDIPFEIKRVFYIYGVDSGNVRGKHANRNSEFVMVCVCGACKVKVRTGTEDIECLLNRPSKALYTGKMTWKEMYDFSSDTVLLCIASEPYDPNEYIYDYSEYLREVVKNRE